MAERRCKDLPDECWELILNRLKHHSQLEPFSLVSKRFLSITNGLRRLLSITDPTVRIHGNVSRLLHRFHHLIHVDLSELRIHTDLILIEIANSGLNLQALDVSNHSYLLTHCLKILGMKMKCLKVLKCSKLQILRDSDLAVIADSCPMLEELDISYPKNYINWSMMKSISSNDIAVTDAGIETLCSSLTSLRMIKLSGNRFITDRSLMFLAKNCFLLREIELMDCSLITHDGLHFMMGNCSQLSTISVSDITPRSVHEGLLTCASTLCELNFYDMIITDNFLYSIVRACIPLKRLTLSFCTDFTFSGFYSLLYAYQSLEYLALLEADFLTDHSISYMCQYLQSVGVIKLGYCSRVTGLAFVTLAKNCPSLKEMDMNMTSIGEEDGFVEFGEYPQIKSLNLARNSHMTDVTLRNIASSCPNLEMLDLCCCFGITDEGVDEILTKCQNITHLLLDDCREIKTMGTGSAFSKLEVLSVARSGINDHGLAVIGKRCNQLLKLRLENCVGVTTRGVKDVVRSCQRLKEIDLKWCSYVDDSIVAWMVFSVPTLAKLTPPSCAFLTENLYKLLLQHGCQVCGY